MLNEHLVIAVEEFDDIVIVREELIVDGPPTGRQASELMIAVLFRMFRALLGPRWRPLSVSFTHPPPSDLSAHRRLFGCEVDFNAEFSGVVLPAADLDRPNPSADPALAQYAEQFVESFPKARPDSALHQVQKAAYHLLPIGRASIGLVAQTLGINERTLQRRLAAEGVHFSDVICEVRRSLALRYLANPTLSVTQVARMLGYGQISSFTRWFIGEFGQAPGQWRRQGQGE
jgi:AraC-like DNA-binding protein